MWAAVQGRIGSGRVQGHAEKGSGREQGAVGAKCFGGGDGNPVLAVVAVTPQKGIKRKFSGLSDEGSGAVVPYSDSPGSGSGRKPQRTLASFWGQSGPQLAVHRSPEHLVKCEQWAKDEAVRQQLAEEKKAKLPGEWLEPVSALPHSGGKRGGRTPVGPQRGVKAGFKRNVRQLGQSTLRRDPSLSFKLAVIMKVEQAASDPTSLSGVVKRQIETDSGFEWATIRGWCKRKQEFQSAFTQLKLGKHGLRPFGSTLPDTKRKSMSVGARLRKATVNYQSQVIMLLKQWFERERMHGHEVTNSLLKDFYIKFLERQSAYCKAQLIWIGQQTASLKKDAVASGWGSGPSKQLALQSEDKQLALHCAKHLSKQLQQYESQRDQLDERIKKMTSCSRKQVDKYFQSIIVQIGAHLRKPARKTRLSPSQEAIRILLTWQSMDRAQYVAVQGTDEELLE